jgi:hypothetical protein
MIEWWGKGEKQKFRKHKHDWKIISKCYAEPKSENAQFHGSQDFMEKIIFGYTTILWKCSICHNLKREEMLGKEQREEIENANTHTMSS